MNKMVREILDEEGREGRRDGVEEGRIWEARWLVEVLEEEGELNRERLGD